MFIKELIKSKVFWISLFIIIIFSGLIIYILIIPKSVCPSGTKRYPQCKDKNTCMPICSVGTFSCETGCSICENINDKPCGETPCCDPKQCNIDPITKKSVCCSIDKLCGSNCCLAEQSCDPITKTCENNCGYDKDNKSILCKDGNICIQNSNMNPESWDRFKKLFPDAVKSKDGKIGFACAKSTCTRPDTNNFPVKIKDFSPCTKLFNKYDSISGDIGYCTSINPSSAKLCWDNGGNKINKNTKTCDGSTNCTYKSVYTTSLNDMQKDMENINISLNDKTEIYKGDWCGPSEQNLIQYTKGTNKYISENINCNVGDCWNNLGNLDGLVDLDWNNDTKICTAIIECNNNIPQKYVNSPCTSNKPSECNPDNKIQCNENGEIRSLSSDFCKSQPSCSVTVATKGKGYCVTGDGGGNKSLSGTGTQNCVNTQSECSDENNQYYLTNILNCPTIDDVTYAGCPIEKTLTYNKDTTLFDCSLFNPSSVCANVNKFGDCKDYSIDPGDGVFLYIENRLPWDIQFNGQGNISTCTNKDLKWCNEHMIIPKFSTGTTAFVDTGTKIPYCIMQFTLNFINTKLFNLTNPYFLGKLQLSNSPKKLSPNITLTGNGIEKFINYKFFPYPIDNCSYMGSIPFGRLVIFPIWMFPDY
jgi:hypothetical protein